MGRGRESASVLGVIETGEALRREDVRDAHGAATESVDPAVGGTFDILTTEAAPKPDKKTGRMPTDEEMAKWQRVIPIMNEILLSKGLVKVADDKILVTGLKGPLDQGWQRKIEAFIARIPVQDQ